MKLMVTGGRDFGDRRYVSDVLSTVHYLHPVDLLIVGDATGVDALATAWAEEVDVPVEVHFAEWQTHGRAAGPIRNKEMVDCEPDLVIAFPGGAGTANAVKTARQANITVIEV